MAVSSSSRSCSDAAFAARAARFPNGVSVESRLPPPADPSSLHSEEGDRPLSPRAPSAAARPAPAAASCHVDRTATPGSRRPSRPGSAWPRAAAPGRRRPGRRPRGHHDHRSGRGRRSGCPARTRRPRRRAAAAVVARAAVYSFWGTRSAACRWATAARASSRACPARARGPHRSRRPPSARLRRGSRLRRARRGKTPGHSMNCATSITGTRPRGDLAKTSRSGASRRPELDRRRAPSRHRGSPRAATAAPRSPASAARSPPATADQVLVLGHVDSRQVLDAADARREVHGPQRLGDGLVRRRAAADH